MNYVTPAGAPNPAPPDPAGLVFAIPREAVVADDFRATLLDFWIHRARLAGHVIAESLRLADPARDVAIGSPEANTATGGRHCGTVRIGDQAFEVYASDSLNQVSALRVVDPDTLALLGLDGDRVTVVDRDEVDDAHRRRVAAAVEHATATGDVTLRLSADEADQLHTLALAGYRQMRADLPRPGRARAVALLQLLSKATTAAVLREKAEHDRGWRFVEQARPVLAGDLDLRLNGIQAAQLIGTVQALVEPHVAEDYAVGVVAVKLADWTGADLGDPGTWAHHLAVARRLLALYREA